MSGIGGCKIVIFIRMMVDFLSASLIYLFQMEGWI